MTLDPIDTLALLSIDVVHTFFHWMLRLRSDTFRAASSLQTYWNYLGLVRLNETGEAVIKVKLKRQWEGVSQLYRSS